MRIIGALVLVAAVALAVVGSLWLVLAIVGREWDYCAGGECIPGELMGLGLVAAGAVAAWVARLLLTRRERR